MLRKVRGGRDRLWWTSVVAMAVFALLLWFDAAPVGHVHTGDTDNLVMGTRRALGCVREGIWSACGLRPGTRFTEVFPYPALQYIPAAAFLSFGLSDAAAVEALARLNTAAFAATIALCAWAFASSDRRGSRALAIAAMLGSSLVYHSTAGFGEALAAATVAAAIVAAIKQRTLLVVVTVALAAIGKDTLLPFVVALGFLCTRSEGKLLPPRRMVVALSAGAVLGATLVAAFNQFRFGQLMNVFYLDPRFRTPGIARKLVFFAGEWLSPSSGLVWYWPIATAVLVVCAGFAAASFVRQPRRLEGWAPGIAVALMAMGFTAGLAAWFSPYGWIAYGPRLAVPLIPGLVIAALHLAGSPLESAMRALLRPAAGLVIVSAMMVGAGWPQFASAWTFGPAITDLVAGDTVCPSMMDTPIEKDAGLYYKCTQHIMWRLHSLPIDEVATEGGNGALAGRLLLATAVIALLASARNSKE